MSEEEILYPVTVTAEATRQCSVRNHGPFHLPGQVRAKGVGTRPRGVESLDAPLDDEHRGTLPSRAWILRLLPDSPVGRGRGLETGEETGDGEGPVHSKESEP